MTGLDDVGDNWGSDYYTKHLVWIFGGRDYLIIYVAHNTDDTVRRIIYEPTPDIIASAKQGDDLESNDLEMDIMVATGGRTVMSARHDW